jgi:hypothetical protein
LWKNQDALLKEWGARVDSNLSLHQIGDPEYAKIIHQIVGEVYSNLRLLLQRNETSLIHPKNHSLPYGNSGRPPLKLAFFLEIFISAEEIFAERLLSVNSDQGFALEYAASSFEEISRKLHELSQLYSTEYCEGCLQPLEMLNGEADGLLEKISTRRKGHV